MNVLFKLLSFLRPYMDWVLLSVLLGAATILGALGLMGSSAYVIAGAALHPSIAELQVAIVGVRFFGLSRGVFRYLERLASHSVNFRLLEKIRVWFYCTIEPLAPAGLQGHRSGDLLARSIGDIETLENFYVRAVSPPLVAVVVTVGMGLYVGQLHWGLASVLGIGLVLAGVGVPYITRQLGKKPGRRIVQGRSEISAAVVESVQGMADFLAFGAEEQKKARFGQLHMDVAHAQHHMARVAGLSSALNLLLTNLTLVMVLVLAIPYLRMGGMDGVTLAVLTLLTLSSFEAVLPLNPAAQYLDASLKAGERIFELEEIEPEVTSLNNGLVPSEKLDIVVLGLGFRYAADRRKAIQQLDLTLTTGKQVALVGASGSGKSTLFNLLLRFWEIQEGQILVNEEPIQKYEPEAIRRAIGWVPQSPQLFTGSLRDNLILSNSARTENDLWESLNAVGLDDWARGLPLGLDTWVGERGFQLSGGERQRISIARVLLRDVQLLLLDEPTANLDNENAARVLEALRRAANGRSAIWSMHQLSNLESMDEIIVLHDGNVLERGTYHQLVDRGGYFSHMLDEQRIAID